MAITGMAGGVYVSDMGTPLVSFTDAATSKDAERKRCQVANSAHRYWPPDEAITVKKNGTVATTGFILERVGGFVVFAAALDADDEVTVTGKALTVAQAGGFFNWSIDGDGDDAEATTFASEGWKEFVRTLKGWSGSAEAYWGDRQFFDSLGEVVVVKLFINSGPSQDCIEGFALINGDSIESPVDGLVQETVDFTGVGPLYLRF